jgi:hypothetical protein
LPAPLPDHGRPRGHRHDLLTIRLAVAFTIEVRLSCRQVAGLLTLLAPLLAVGVPAFSTVRLWLLRLGLAVLRHAACTVAGGWTLVIDHSLGRGTRECFVVLGIPTAALRGRGDYRLGLADMAALAIEVMDGSDGDKVAAALRPLLGALGRVNQIVCDQGTDLLRGVRILAEDYPGIALTYDVRHLCAALLRGQLRGCPRWGAFARLCGQAAHRVRQTAGSFLAPPALRDKARYMNLETHLDWARRLLAWRAAPDWEGLAGTLGRPPEQTRQWYDERFAWLEGFGRDVRVWSGLLRAADLAVDEVQRFGLSRQTAGRFWLRWRQAGPAEDLQAEQYAGQVRSGLREQGAKLKAGEVALGSSDVIESLFGRYKEVMGRGPEKEVSGDALLMALLCGPGLSNGQIRAGLERLSTEQLSAWMTEQFGPSDRAKKRDLFGGQSPEKTSPLAGPKSA